MTAADSVRRPLVLVVEDDDAIAGAISIVVSKVGGEPRRGSDGLSGLELFFEHPFELVVLDIGLPVLDGWEVLKRIREVSDVAVLIVTASILDDGQLRGATDYVAKPFSIKDLGSRIADLLESTARSSEDAQTHGGVGNADG